MLNLEDVKGAVLGKHNTRAKYAYPARPEFSTRCL